MHPQFGIVKEKPELLHSYPTVIRLPVQWGDQDAFGHVNNTIPLRWFESSRVAYLESSGLEHWMQPGGLGPILASLTSHYRRQLRYPDTVLVGTRVSKMGRTSFVMKHAVYSERQQLVAVEGESIAVVFDYSKQQPVRIPDDVRTLIVRFEPLHPEGAQREE